MKRPLLLLASSVVIAATVGYIATCKVCDRFFSPCCDHHTWLQKEFNATPAQIAAIEKIQADYQPVCDQHCAAIRAAEKRFAELHLSSADPQALATAKNEIARLKKICADATLAHLREIAAQLPAGQRDRFLALVAPKITGHDHQAAFRLP